MKLLTYKNGWRQYTYYVDKNDVEVRHGELKYWYSNGQIWEHSFYYHGKTHGERKRWNHNGGVIHHLFCIDGEGHPYVEMDAQEKLLFQIKYPGFRFIEE